MSYLQPGGGHAGHMGMYNSYPHYQSHGSHASPQQHYSHMPSQFGGQPGSNPQSMLGSNPGEYAGGVHPSSYSHMAPQHGMYYHDPSGASAMHGMMHPAHASHGQVPGLMAPAGTMPGSAYASTGVGHHAQQAPASTKASGKASKSGASTGKKGASAVKKEGGSKAAKAAAAGLPADAAPASGKAKSSKSSAASADRHHPYEDKPAKPAKKEKKEPAKPPVLKSHLKPPKQAPSAWQVYFTEELQKIKAENPGARLNVAHVAKDAGQRYAALPDERKKEFQRRSQEAKAQWEQDMRDWKNTLTPEDIKQENMYRTAQRKAGKSRKGNLKDPNAPKKPLSAYFLFLRAIRADPKMTEDVFHGEQETTKQSVLAAAKWRSLGEVEKHPFLEKAEADKVEYERARKEYDRVNGLSGTHDEGSSYDYEGEGGIAPSLAAGGAGDDAFKLEGHFGLAEDPDLGFPGSLDS
ncbi:unnamed protein product [Sympodiomycopsis kandeliae]